MKRVTSEGTAGAPERHPSRSHDKGEGPVREPARPQRASVWACLPLHAQM